MTKTQLSVGAIAVGLLGIAAYLSFVPVLQAAVSFQVPTQPVNTYKVIPLLTATTTTATSTNLSGGGGYAVVAGAKSVVAYFSRGDTTGQGNSGSTVFKLEVSPDGTSWHMYNTLLQNAATSTDQTSLATVTVPAGTSTTMVYMQNLGFYALRCIAVETTDGEHSCKVGVEY